MVYIQCSVSQQINPRPYQPQNSSRGLLFVCPTKTSLLANLPFLKIGIALDCPQTVIRTTTNGSRSRKYLQRIRALAPTRQKPSRSLVQATRRTRGEKRMVSLSPLKLQRMKMPARTTLFRLLLRANPAFRILIVPSYVQRGLELNESSIVTHVRWLDPA